MFVQKVKRKREEKKGSDFFLQPQKPQKRAKPIFTISDDILTSHLFNAEDSLLQQLSNPDVEDASQVMGMGGDPKKRIEECVWKDMFLAEQDIQELPGDSIQSKFVKNYMEKKRLSNLTGGEYEECLREVYEKFNPKPDWWMEIEKKVIKEEQMNKERRKKGLDLYSTTENVALGDKLAGFEIKFLKQQNLNVFEMPSKKSKILDMKFHPMTNMAQVLSSDNVLRIYKLNGSSNPMVQKFFNFAKERVRKCAFSQGGRNSIVSTDSCKYFKCDLEKGEKKEFFVRGNRREKWGNFAVSNNGSFLAFINDSNGIVELIDSKTNYSITKFTTNSPINDVCFSSDDKLVYGVTKNCKIYIWSIEKKRVINILNDRSVELKKVDVSQKLGFLAVGCVSGMVNIYNIGVISEKNKWPKPIKVLKNITTEISMLKFNEENELLCAGSDKTEDKLRIFKCPNFECLEHFPNFGKFGKERNVICRHIGFSNNGTFFAIGLDRRVYLYKVIK